jgi:hypothetical protein
MSGNRAKRNAKNGFESFVHFISHPGLYSSAHAPSARDHPGLPFSGMHPTWCAILVCSGQGGQPPSSFLSTTSINDDTAPSPAIWRARHIKPSTYAAYTSMASNSL